MRRVRSRRERLRERLLEGAERRERERADFRAVGVRPWWWDHG